jgi:CHAD domain-containing protein
LARAREITGLDPAMPMRAAATLVVGTRAQEVFEHEHRALDTNDIEGVHDMRVATRRLRAALEVFAVCFPKREHREILRDVKALADALGARRDPDVVLAELEQIAKRLPPAARAGVESFAADARAAQAEGNARLERELARVRTTELERRLRELVGG